MYLHHQFFDDHNSVRLKKQQSRCLVMYAYDHALKFSILQENPSLKQTETPTASTSSSIANFVCKLGYSTVLYCTVVCTVQFMKKNLGASCITSLLH